MSKGMTAKEWACDALYGITAMSTLQAVEAVIILAMAQAKAEALKERDAELDALHSVMRIQEQTWKRAEAILRKILMGHPYSIDEVRQAYDPIPKAAALTSPGPTL